MQTQRNQRKRKERPAFAEATAGEEKFTTLSRLAYSFRR